MHAIFALHYAHQFYGGTGSKRTGGLIFRGDEDPIIGTFSTTRWSSP